MKLLVMQKARIMPQAKERLFSYDNNDDYYGNMLFR